MFFSLGRGVFAKRYFQDEDYITTFQWYPEQSLSVSAHRRLSRQDSRWQYAMSHRAPSSYVDYGIADPEDGKGLGSFVNSRMTVSRREIVTVDGVDRTDFYTTNNCYMTYCTMHKHYVLRARCDIRPGDELLSMYRR